MLPAPPSRLSQDGAFQHLTTALGSELCCGMNRNTKDETTRHPGLYWLRQWWTGGTGTCKGEGVFLGDPLDYTSTTRVTPVLYR